MSAVDRAFRGSAIALVACQAMRQGIVTIDELARALSITKHEARRARRTLVQLGWITLDEHGHIRSVIGGPL